MIKGKWYRYVDEDKFLKYYGYSEGHYLFNERVNIKTNKKYSFCNFHPVNEGWLRPATKEEIEKFNLK